MPQPPAYRHPAVLSLTALLLALTAVTVLALYGLPTRAQDSAADDVALVSGQQCSTPLSSFWVTASDACVGQPFGFVCNGGQSPSVEPVGPVSNSLAALGALVETDVVDALHTPPLQADGSGGGIAWLRVAAPDTLVQYSALLIGEVRLRDVTPADFNFPAWQSLLVETIPADSRCEKAPVSAFVIQSLPNQSARVVVNGTSLDLSGTVVVQTGPGPFGSQTHFMLINGDLSVLANGISGSATAGQEISTDYAAGDFSRPLAGPNSAVTFRREQIEHLPVLLFDRPVSVPQGGVATTLGPVNFRSAPTLDSNVIEQVPAGEQLNILGRNPAGDWLHLRRATGPSGWMFAELLSTRTTMAEVEAVYVETPQPLQRLGELGQAAQVIAPSGTVMRSAPDIGFGALGALPFGQELTLMARSPYSPWVKVDSGGTVGWVALIAVETRAIVDALPIDYDVPPPPEPTRIPGSFGNAFPDPNCYPNCGN